MLVLSDLEGSRQFSPDRLCTLRERAIRAAVADPGQQATWLSIEEAGDNLASLQNVLIRVLHLDSDPIGFGIAQLETTPRLTALYIHPAFQRRGLGRNILSALSADLMATGAATLSTAAAAPAQPFYLALGFQRGFSYCASPTGWEQGPRMYFHHMTAAIPALGFVST